MPSISRRRFLDLTTRTAAGLGAAGLLGFPRLTLSASAADPAAAGPHAAALAAIDTFTQRHLRERGIPGMTVGIADRSGVLAVRTYGSRDVKTGAAVLPDDLFEIGSITKSFIGIALLQLHEAGRLDLQRPIVDDLPWLRIESAFAPITVHHLLTHSSGLPNPLALPSVPLWTAHAPGEHFHYCNLGYDILGRLLESVYGKPLKEILTARILKPLGMNATSPVISHDLRLRMPVSYWPVYDDRPFPRHGPLAEAPHLAMDDAAGCIVSTAHDMALFMAMLLNRGRGLLSGASFRRFSTPAIPAPSFGEGSGYGYGIAIQPVEGRTLLRHTGGMVSFSSAMQVDLDDGFGVFASVNASLAGYRPNAVAAYALAVLRAERDGKALPPLPELDDPFRIPDAAALAGTFTAPNGRKLTVAADGTLLRLLHNGEGIPLERIAPDTFFVSHQDFERFPLSFGREGRNGDTVVEVNHGADWYPGERYQGPRTFEAPPEWKAYAGHYRNDSPWEGSAILVLRKGRLWAGDTPLVPLGTGLFRIGEESHNPDRIRFETVVDSETRARALRAVINGVDYRRLET